MATGTGKTYTAFQIVWRLKQAQRVKNVLYLADRNQLIDQTMVGDFGPYGKTLTKIKNGEINKNYEIYFGLYQQLSGDDEDATNERNTDDLIKNYQQVSRNYFDLIIVDECHRGSAREESNWRAILDYFNSAIQIGMTATPNSKEGANNLEYFGAPLYTYSLKQGIDDGFLAPYQVVTVRLDKDRDGWTPEPGEKDFYGQLIPQRLYTLQDFNSTLILTERINTVAKVISEYLSQIGKYSKTIVFCKNQRHAAMMRDALRKFNPTEVNKDPNYVVRMTADDKEGKSLYSNFTSIKERYPVIATTSKLLTTGADTKCVKLIVLDTNIASMTEFKQIIGRGTRLREDAGKTFFTILDFYGNCALFKDPDFDGVPDGEEVIEPAAGDPWQQPKKPEQTKPETDGGGDDTGTDDGAEKPLPIKPQPTIYTVLGGTVTVIGKEIQYLNEDGKLVIEKFEDYTRKNILKLFGSHSNFMEVWNGTEEKKAIIDKLEQNGVLFEALRKEAGNAELDEFDLVCGIAYGTPPLTRSQRAYKAKKAKFLEKYQGVCRSVMEKLLDVYARTSVTNIESVDVLRTDPFKQDGGQVKIIKAFGGKNNYQEAVRDMEAFIYPIESTIKETTSQARI
jgi:type I restriction enzyme R subunit